MTAPTSSTTTCPARRSPTSPRPFSTPTPTWLATRSACSSGSPPTPIRPPSPRPWPPSADRWWANRSTASRCTSSRRSTTSTRHPTTSRGWRGSNGSASTRWSTPPTSPPIRVSTSCGASSATTASTLRVPGPTRWAARRSWWPSSTPASTSTTRTWRPTSGPTRVRSPATASTTTATATSTTCTAGTSSTTTPTRTMTTTTAPTWPAPSPPLTTPSEWSASPRTCRSWRSSSFRPAVPVTSPTPCRRCPTPSTTGR